MYDRCEKNESIEIIPSPGMMPYRKHRHVVVISDIEEAIANSIGKGQRGGPVRQVFLFFHRCEGNTQQATRTLKIDMWKRAGSMISSLLQMKMLVQDYSYLL